MGNGLALINPQGRVDEPTRDDPARLQAGAAPPTNAFRFVTGEFGSRHDSTSTSQDLCGTTTARKLLYTSEESGRTNLYVVDTSDL